MMTLAVILCHLIHAGEPPACHREIVATNVSMSACMMSQVAVADWKSKTFSQDEYTVQRIMCFSGNRLEAERE